MCEPKFALHQGVALDQGGKGNDQSETLHPERPKLLASSLVPGVVGVPEGVQRAGVREDYAPQEASP